MVVQRSASAPHGLLVEVCIGGAGGDESRTPHGARTVMLTQSPSTRPKARAGPNRERIRLLQLGDCMGGTSTIGREGCVSQASSAPASPKTAGQRQGSAQFELDVEDDRQWWSASSLRYVSGTDDGPRLQTSKKLRSALKSTSDGTLGVRPNTVGGFESGAMSTVADFASSFATGGRLPSATRGLTSATASLDNGQDPHLRAELVRLRKQLHRTSCELTKTREQLEFHQRELHAVRSDNAELRIKCSHMERSAKTTGAELLEERCKSDELSKQVKAMSQNLMSIMGHQKGTEGTKEIMGLQKRCFKLVQQNTALTVQSRLLRRQKGWAEAKARVLQDEVTRVYLGTHDQVKSWQELDHAVNREFSQRESATSGAQRDAKCDAQIVKLIMPVAYKHKEAVIDFLTHITHTGGNDVLGFLSSNRVFSEGIRSECLNGLGREYFAHWRLVRQLPCVLRATERIVHLGEYIDAFDGYSKEVSELLGCASAKLWVADHLRQVLWTCVRNGDETTTIERPIPRNRDAENFAGCGLAVAACVEQRVISCPDASADRRADAMTDASNGRMARSALCVPVVQKGAVRVVLQAVNKLAEPDFDVENDARVLRLLGRVAMEVLQVCENNSTQSAFAKRKDALLQLFNDFVPCQTPVQLVNAVEVGLRELFHSKTVALHSVTNRDAPLEQQGTTLMQVPDSQNRVTRRRRSSVVQHIKHTGLRGIVGSVVRSMNHYTYSFAQLGQSPHNPEVDLKVPEKGVLHTVPLVDSGGVAAVIQFVCPDRERSIVGDNGTFRPDNMQHMRLINVLLRFVQKHIAVLQANGPEGLQQGLLRTGTNSPRGAAPRNVTIAEVQSPLAKDGVILSPMAGPDESFSSSEDESEEDGNSKQSGEKSRRPGSPAFSDSEDE